MENEFKVKRFVFSSGGKLSKQPCLYAELKSGEFVPIIYFQKAKWLSDKSFQDVLDLLIVVQEKIRIKRKEEK